MPRYDFYSTGMAKGKCLTLINKSNETNTLIVMLKKHVNVKEKKMEAKFTSLLVYNKYCTDLRKCDKKFSTHCFKKKIT